MNRKEERHAAATALRGLDVFQQVYDAPVRSFGGQSPVAVVLGGGTTVQQLSRATAQTAHTVTATVYTLNETGNAEAEDQHDDTVVASLTALREAGFLNLESDAAPDGAPLRNIDGKYYRTERITLRRP